MLKNLATALVALAIVVGSAHADAKNGGIARQIAMGGSQAGSGLILNPFIMDDPALLLLNPAYQAMYKDYAWMNIGGGGLTGLTTGNNGYGQQNAGIAFAFGREWSLGAILSYDPSAANAVKSLLSGAPSPAPGFPGLASFIPNVVRGTGGGGPITGAQTIPNILNVWEIVATYDLGSVDLGFGFMYGNSNSDYKTTVPAPATSIETEASASLFGFRAGANIDLGGGSSFDLSGILRLDKATDNVKNNPVVANQGGEYSASGTEMVFNARGKFKMSNKVNFVPYGTLGILSAEPKEDAPLNTQAATTASEKVSSLAFAVGIGGEFKTPSFYLAGGVSVQSASAKLEANSGGATPTASTTKGTYFALPVLNIGGEWWFTDWLAGRGGYYRSLGKTKVELESTTGGVSNGSSEANNTFPNSFVIVGGIGPATHDGLVTLGLGFRFGGFALDATVSEEALRRGLGLIGAQDNINTFGYLTGSYNFE